MSFLRVENKKSGTYLRIVESYRDKNRVCQRTVYSLGKVEDYAPSQLERIAKKLLELAGCRLEDIVKDDLKEIRRVNYGYALVIKHLWKKLRLDEWMRKINYKRRIRFDWLSSLELMISERLNDPCSKRSSFFHQTEYIGFGDSQIDLHHLYRTLDILSEEQSSLKKHLFTTQQSLFSSQLDVVFYDVTTLYFASEKEVESSIRQKGYSKDGKFHKTQVVLVLLVDKLRNPISYHIYKGNTYEGKTMIEALESLRKDYNIDKVIVVADSGMMNKDNLEFIEKQSSMDYIIGDRLRNLPEDVIDYLLSEENHKPLFSDSDDFTYSCLTYRNRRIICTYSEKRAIKDRNEREKLIAKAKKLLDNPSKLRHKNKTGTGRFIKQLSDEKFVLDIEKIILDERFDGYKAISTTSDLSIEEVLDRYGDLFEVEHTFRTLKSQLRIRPMFHWTDKRIEGHIAMCFIAYTMLNYLRLSTGMQIKEIVNTLDEMQLSEIQEGKVKETFFLRSSLSENQKKLINKLNIEIPRDVTSQHALNLLFK